jgi:Protein of unknown function (DUF1207).
VKEIKPVKKFYLLLLELAIIGCSTSNAGAVPTNDQYIAGYATAVLEREFNLTAASLSVKDGVITLSTEDLAGSDREKINAVLGNIRGVVRVAVIEFAPPVSQQSAIVRDRSAAKAEISPPGPIFLPPGRLFDPLIADPRWPHFSGAYHYYLDDVELRNVGAANFGGDLPLYRNDFPWGGQWELGLQAGVFSIFDLDASSTDLVNADYLVGIPLSYRTGNLSALLRIFHQSSHLGDEFVLRNRVNRINLSFENVDVKLSYDFYGTFRLYGSGGHIFRKEPSDIKPWSTQVGIEFKSPWTYLEGIVRPVAAVDIQHTEENEWDTDLSARAGIQFESTLLANRQVQLLLEYYNGRSPNGQFFERNTEYLGIGAHLLID